MTRNGDIHGTFAKRQWYTRGDVSIHSNPGDCWVVVFDRVIDLSELVKSDTIGSTVELVKVAGSDISHWFVQNDQSGLIEPKMVISKPGTSVAEPLGPLKPFMNFPWWRDDSLLVGHIASQEQRIIIENMLTGQRQSMIVPVDETLAEVSARYLVGSNLHANSYTWKRLGRPLLMSRTLTDNGVPNEGPKMSKLGLEEMIPVLHLYFNDDLTEA